MIRSMGSNECPVPGCLAVDENAGSVWGSVGGR